MLLAGLPVGDGTPAVFDPDFLENIFEVELHRIQTNFEDNRNFPVGLARRDPTEDLFFPFTQQNCRMSRSLRLPR